MDEPHSSSGVLLLESPLMISPSLLQALASAATVIISIPPSRVVLLQVLKHLALASSRSKF